MDGIVEAWAEVERLRQAGWLVVVKAMPDGHPFLLGDDWTRDPQVRARFFCSAQWMPSATVAGARRSINAHPLGKGDTLGEAVAALAADVAEVEACYAVG